MGLHRVINSMHSVTDKDHSVYAIFSLAQAGLVCGLTVVEPSESGWGVNVLDQKMYYSSFYISMVRIVNQFGIPYQPSQRTNPPVIPFIKETSIIPWSWLVVFQSAKCNLSEGRHPDFSPRHRMSAAIVLGEWYECIKAGREIYFHSGLDFSRLDWRVVEPSESGWE